MQNLMNKALEIENDKNVYSVTVSIVQPWMNIKGAGCAVLVYAKDEITAQKNALELAGDVWDLRNIAVVDLISVKDAIEQAKSFTKKPVLLVDSADSPSAGAPGDSADVIKGLIEHGEGLNALANIVDPEVVRLASSLGENNTGYFNLGRKIAPRFGSQLHYMQL